MILLPTLMLSTLAALPQARVTGLDGSSSAGELTAATLETVSWKDGDGGERKLAAGEVLRLRMAPTNELLAQGEQLADERDWSNAAASFEGAAAADGPFWMQPWASLRRAECLLAAAEGGGAATAAVAAYEAWATANADSWWIPRARIGQAKALILAGRSDAASTLMQSLSDLAFEKNLPRHVEMEAALVRARSFLAGNQADVAEARLRDLVGKADSELSGGNLPRGVRSRVAQVHVDAQILLGGALEAKSGAATAAAYWQALADDPRASADVRAAAWTGLAAAARAEGKLREAQILLGRVVATLTAGPEVMGRALYELGELSQETGDKPVTGRRYFEMILERYPDSTWAAKAQARIGG